MTEQRQHIGVSATALCETQEQVARAIEALSRTAAGLALEGIGITVNAVPYDPDEE